MSIDSYRWADLGIMFSLIALLSGCEIARKPLDPQVLEMAKAGEAYFEEKCKTIAGEKIYRSVPNIEGIMLMKVRPSRGERQLEDPMWPGAAFAAEVSADSYIESFLGYERAAGKPDGKPSAIASNNRGYIASDGRSGDKPGYRYADVIDAKDGREYRYSQVYREVDSIRGHDFAKVKIMKYVLEKKIADIPLPRYGVTYEDHVISTERAIGVASSTVKIIDLNTNEVLGEMIRYAYRPRGLKLTEWLTSRVCPNHPVGFSSATRKFVDQVLIPKGE